jgi:hypothetical protein
MKLNYKKTTLLILTSTMGIGVLTLSIAPNVNKPNKMVKDSAVVDNMTVKTANIDETDAISITVSPTLTVTSALTATTAPSPTPTLSPTPATLPVYELEDNTIPEIDTLIKNYYNAKLNCDLKALEKLLSDTSNLPTKKQLKNDVLFVEEYNNIKCYVKKGFIDDTYIAYVYNEIKFYNIKTPAPGVDQFYLIPDENGKYIIFSGQFDEQTSAYYNARNDDEDVKKLFDDVSSKIKKAKKKDKAFKDFIDNLEKYYGATID